MSYLIEKETLKPCKPEWPICNWCEKECQEFYTITTWSWDDMQENRIMCFDCAKVGYSLRTWRDIEKHENLRKCKVCIFRRACELSSFDTVLGCALWEPDNSLLVRKVVVREDNED